MSGQRVVELGDKQDEYGLGAQQHVCANPRCDVQFDRLLGPGRPKDFHDEDCRRSAEKDLRRILSQLAHYERQVATLKARAQSYVRTTVDDADLPAGPTTGQREAARDAIVKVSGMSRFLPNHQGEFAQDLLDLYSAVAPLVS